MDDVARLTADVREFVRLHHREGWASVVRDLNAGILAGVATKTVQGIGRKLANIPSRNGVVRYVREVCEIDSVTTHG